MLTLKQYKEEMLKNAEVKKEYDVLEEEYKSIRKNLNKNKSRFKNKISKIKKAASK